MVDEKMLRQIGFFGALFVIVLWVYRYRVLIVLPKQEQKKKDAVQNSSFFIKEYFLPNYGQSKEVGIFIQNTSSDKKDIAPQVRIIGDVEIFEYGNNLKLKRISGFLPPANNRVFNFSRKIKFNIPENIIFAKIEKGNLVFLSNPENSVKSFPEYIDCEYFFPRTRYEFNFEIWDDVENEFEKLEKFASQIYSFWFELYERHGEAYLEVGKPKPTS